MSPNIDVSQLQVFTGNQAKRSNNIAPSGTKFATTSFDKTTRFFDLTTFEPIGEPLDHPHVVWGVAFSEDSQLIVTGCWDNLSALKKTIPGPKPRRERAGLSQGFFDDFDARSTPRRNNRSVPTGSRIQKTMNRLLFRSPAPQDHNPHPRRIPVVDVFATRAHRQCTSGKRHLLQPPRLLAGKAQTSNAGAPNSSVPPAELPSAAFQIGGAGASAATNRPPSLVDVERGTEISCLALLLRYFSRFSETRKHILLLPAPARPSCPFRD
ncbi:uncharacterized protein EDB91DRAFT_1350051 [Suillus paluster]|uniref:uncharacterized protein n=1 Tax=Suillus paluster TaxID=48578 RepID=UPI001B871598|nr:uncharacterized protein EDB91DRAFT_1350051 [Suillus paluster]KAG1728632.1 hypothetical protein EDB91DRAFT_1350051 [Suillus paluster]